MTRHKVAEHGALEGKMNTKRPIYFLAATTAVLLSHAPKAHAWGDTGHETVAEIAERFIADDTKRFVQKILGPEPLVIAATFPDQVRSDARFKGFAPYHFVEIAGGTEYKPGERKNGHTILHKAPGLLRSAELSRERKMILLRYLIHVVGDVHQPLHVGNGFDMGANLCDVTWVRPENYEIERKYKAASAEEKAKMTLPKRDDKNLHSVWDDALLDVMKEEFQAKAAQSGRGKPWFGYKELSDWVLSEAIGTTDPRKEGEAKGKYSRAQLREWADSPLLTWYSESRSLHDRVYPEKPYVDAPDKRVYCKMKDEKTGKVVNGAKNPKIPYPVLDEEYSTARTPLIRLQLLKGGIRLARLLDRVAKGQDVEVQKDVEILESVLIENDE